MSAPVLTVRARAAACLAGLVLAVSVCAGSAHPASAADVAPPAKVLIVMTPSLTWDRTKQQLPTLWSFASRGAVASMSTRTAGERSDPAAGYLTVGSGRRAGSSDPATAGAAVQRAIPGDGSVIVASNFSAQVDANDGLRYGAVPGSFGQALVGAGRVAVPVGNAGRTTTDVDHRAVALSAVAGDGTAPGGAVGGDLLVTDTAAPFGVRLDVERVVAETERSLAEADVVVLELSDLERADQAAATDPGAAAGWWANAASHSTAGTGSHATHRSRSWHRSDRNRPPPRPAGATPASHRPPRRGTGTRVRAPAPSPARRRDWSGPGSVRSATRRPQIRRSASAKSR